MIIRYDSIDDFISDVGAKPFDYVGPVRVQRTHHKESLMRDLYQVSLLSNPGGLVTADGQYLGRLMPVIYEGELTAVQHHNLIDHVMRAGFTMAKGRIELC